MNIYNTLVKINESITHDSFLLPQVFCVLDALTDNRVSKSCECNCEECIKKYVEREESPYLEILTGEKQI